MRENSARSRRYQVFFAALILAILVVSAGVYAQRVGSSSSSRLSTSSAAPDDLPGVGTAEDRQPTGVIVPMFTNYSLIDVPTLLQAKAAHPSVPMMVVANPEDGPGDAYNSTYGAGLLSLREAGITVLGYVPTGWGERSIASVESDISTFYEWYGVDGIYLDQMYNMEFSQSGAYMPNYYSTLARYADSLGMHEVFGNSGADIPYYFLGSVDTIGYFENHHLPLLSALGGWHTDYSKVDFAFFAYNVTLPDPPYVAAASDYVGYLYVTDGTMPSPYSGLPQYFDRLVSELASLVPVTVETATPNGNVASRGFNVTVTQPDGTKSGGWAPSTFEVVSGSTVTVSVKDSGGYLFDHWSTGSENNTIVIRPTTATTLVAYSKTSVTNASVVTVHSQVANGVPVTGIWTTAAANGSVVAAGYTPFSFVATRGADYSLTIANYKTYNFSFWSNGSEQVRGNRLTITPNQEDMLLNAYYVNGTAGADASSSTGTAKTTTT